MNTPATSSAPGTLDLSWIYRSEAFAEDLSDSHPPERERAMPQHTSLRDSLRHLGAAFMPAGRAASALG